MNRGTYSPASKQQRVPTNPSQTFGNFDGIHRRHMCTDSRSHSTHPVSHVNSLKARELSLNCLTYTDPSVTAFKSQLKEIFEIFPPFTEFISSQPHPQQSFQELYQVFVASDPYNHTHALPPSNINRARACPSQSQSNSFHSKQIDEASFPPPICDPTTMFSNAKEQMIGIASRNVSIRCDKIIQSLNHSMQNHPKYYAFHKQFVLNDVTKMDLAYAITNTLRSWEGGNSSPVQTREELTEDKAFKLVRAHWNRQKAQKLGDTLFCLVLQNIFKIVLQIRDLSCKEQAIFYIDLFRGLLSCRVQFERSMPRPLVPNACFAKATVFKKFCENILDSFSGGVVRMMHAKSVETCEVNGRKVTKYVQNSNRSKSLADSYDNCLERVKMMMSNATAEVIQHLVQLHLNCIDRPCYELVQLRNT